MAQFSGSLEISGSLYVNNQQITPGGGGSGSAFPYTGSAAISGSLTINDVLVQFYNPASSPYQVPNYTIYPSASITNNINISQSGIYNIDFSSFTSSLSCSLNIYYHLDTLPTNSETQILFNLPSATASNICTYRVLVTASNSTEWWAQSAVGTTTGTLTRGTLAQRRYTGLNGATPHQVVKSPYGTYLTKTNLSYEETFLSKYTGSAGTPI